MMYQLDLKDSLISDKASTYKKYPQAAIEESKQTHWHEDDVFRHKWKHIYEKTKIQFHKIK